jgi:putative transposase
MSTTDTPLLPGYIYHIYNRGLDKQTTFLYKEQYFFFLELMKKYFPNAYNVYAYCLMPNHFHLLIYVMDENSNKPHFPLSHMINTYTQKFNRLSERKGALFERPFKKKKITNNKYFWQLICYIHHNPYHHRIGDYKDYPWSSYKTILSSKPTYINRKEVLTTFGGQEDFITMHEQELDYRDIRDSLIED